MNRAFVLLAFILGGSAVSQAHDFGTAITWNREISRIFYAKCATCHREGGTSFSLVTFADVQPVAVAIKNEVLSRRMPPWGAVKGFGDFRDDQGLSPEEIELITSWVESGTRKGNNPNVLPKVPKFKKLSAFKTPKNGITVSGELTLDRAIKLDGLLPEKVPQGVSMQITAVFPDGSVEPLLWLYEYTERHRHPFLFRKPLVLPAGTVVRGVLPDAKIVLIRK